MGYFYLFLQALIFSFGGLMIKSAGTLVTPLFLSFLRFAIGLALLFIIEKIHTGRIRLRLTSVVIIAGGLLKALHYLMENLGVMRGYSYGGILVWPVQTIVVMVFSCIFGKERFSFRVILGAFLCVFGIGMVSWNGAPASVFFEGQVTTMLFFILAGVGAAGFSIAQKKMVHSMDIVELNSSMFFFSLIITLVTLAPSGTPVTGSATVPAVLCVFLLGVVTCVGFLLQAVGIKTVPLLIATIIQSSTVLLSILWGVLIYGDPVSGYIIVGSLVFLAGIVLVNLPGRERQNAANQNS